MKKELGVLKSDIDIEHVTEEAVLVVEKKDHSYNQVNERIIQI
jgi:hypothetical protein